MAQALAAKGKKIQRKKEKAEKKKKGKLKTTVEQYKSDLKKAYNDGYKRGWSAAEVIPNRRGVTVSATAGYEKGVSEKRKLIKHERKAQELKNKREKMK